MEAAVTFDILFLCVLALLWIAFFIVRPDLRKEMLIVGVLSLLLLPLTFTIDGTHAQEVESSFNQLQVFDLLFAFTLSGIAATAFHALFGKHYHRLPAPTSARGEEALAQTWLLRIFFILIAFCWIAILMRTLFDASLAVAVFTSAAAIAIYIVSHRKDLLLDVLWSGVLTTIIVFVCALIATFFADLDASALTTLTGPKILGIPSDILLWSAALGFGIGPIYEYIRRLNSHE